MIVMKFGGTSVGSATRMASVAALVKSRLSERPIVVVSAVGGMTNLLLEGGEKALRGEFPEEVLGKIRETHNQITRELRLDTAFLDDFYQKLAEVYQGIALLREFTPRTWDLVASFGERISARILAACLKQEGVEARAYDSWEIGFLTTSESTQARLLPEAEEMMRKTLAAQNGVPVVTGFIGKDRQGHITTLGRGGSDFSASLIGGALRAKHIEIWTDVPGIMTADPRVVPLARTLPSVSFQEAAELSYFGAKILHPKTIEPAMKRNIPVLVKSTFKPDDPGTLIVPKPEHGKHFTAITFKQGITTLNLYSTGMLEARGFLAKIFQILEQHGISVDVVSTSEVNVSLTLDNTDGLEAAMPELSELAQVSAERDRAIVCIVGEGMKKTPGIASRVFRVLGDSKINIEMISQGASEINITFVVKSEEAAKAVQVLHREFFE